MKEIIFYCIVTGLLFFGFLSVFIIGWVKKSRNLIIISFFILLSSILIGFFSGYTFISKSYTYIAKGLKPRTGEEIYTALFGSPQNPCLKVIHHRDQRIPIIEEAIWLHFKTCPEECARILSEYKYSWSKVKASEVSDSNNYGEVGQWWRPKTIGDSIFMYDYDIDKGRNMRLLWVSKDSTEVYCKDVLY